MVFCTPHHMTSHYTTYRVVELHGKPLSKYQCSKSFALTASLLTHSNWRHILRHTWDQGRRHAMKGATNIALRPHPLFLLSLGFYQIVKSFRNCIRAYLLVL